MGLDSVFGRPLVRRPYISSGGVVENERPAHFPSTTKVHAGLVRTGIELKRSFVIITPSDRSEFIPLLALESLFTNTKRDRNAIFVLSSNTEVRERFRGLAPKSTIPPHDKATYSRQEMPIANVKADGSLATVTKNIDHPDKPPRFLFSYTSTRVPTDSIGERIKCVIYDGSVKYTPERLGRLRQWQERNNIPSGIYLTSNPAGGIVEDLSKDALIWNWPPQLLSQAILADEAATNSRELQRDPISETTRQTQITKRRESIRSQGVSFEVHTCGDGELNELLVEANVCRIQFEKLISKMNSETLDEAKPLIRSSLRAFQELLSPLDLTTYHERRTSIPARIAGLDRFQSRIGSDPEASPAGGTYRNFLDAVERLKSSWDEAPTSHKKEGQLVELLYAVLDLGESVTVIASAESHVQALVAYLRTEQAELYQDLGDDLKIRSGHSVRSAVPTDNAILYGSLRWNHRDLLRTDIAPNVVIIAYPIEMGLLHAQVKTIDDANEHIANLKFWEVVDRLTQRACGEEASIRQVDIEVPDQRESIESTLGRHISIADIEEEDLGELVRTYKPTYNSSVVKADSSEFTTSEDVELTADGSGEERNTRTESDCLDIRFVDGRCIYYRPEDSTHVVRHDHNKLLKKRAKSLKSGDLVVYLDDMEAMRDKLYDLIRERGDIGLYYYANLWRVSLEAAIKQTGDELSDFIQKMEGQGLEKHHHTYERWYEFEVQRTRSKKSLRAIAEAYQLNGVKENFNEVWNAVQDMQTIYRQLKTALRNSALRSVSEDTTDDVMLSESPDIRLSDFNVSRYLYQLEVSAVESSVEAPVSQIERLREA